VCHLYLEIFSLRLQYLDFDVRVKEALFLKIGRSKSETFARWGGGFTQEIVSFLSFFKEIDSALPYFLDTNLK